MKVRSARLLTYVVVAALAVIAIQFTPRLPERKPAADLLLQQGEPAAADTSAAPTSQARHDTLGRGESLVALLQRAGLADSDAAAALHAATAGSLLDARRIPAGMPVTVSTDSGSTPDHVVLQLAIDRLIHLRRTTAGWTGEEQRLPWTTDTVAVSGTITSNLYAAMDSAARTVLPAAARQQLTWTLADVFEYRVDMSRDLQAGDSFRVMVERSSSPTGAVRVGNILAATFDLSGSEVQAVRFASHSVSGDYFDQNGKSLRAAFLRAPLEFRRISSVFGLRFHPILGRWRNHDGIDYAAAPGTPVRAIGDAVVVRAGWAGGYGNLIELRHRNGYVTRYGHLRAFAKGVHAGAHVSIGQTIAYVGTTGLSTGPHLHFEVRVNGVQRDPRTALRSTGGDPIPSSERVAFAQLRDRLINSLDGTTTGTVKLAMR